MKSFFGIFFLAFIHFQSVASPYNLFEENGKVGLKDQNGSVVIPATYESLGWSEGEFSLLGNVTGYKLNGLWGLINLSNQRVTPAEFISLKKGNNSMIIAAKRSTLTFRTTVGCLSESGKTLIPFDYSGIELTDLRAIVVTRDGGAFKYGVVDFDNKILIPLKYRTIIPIGSLRFAVENFERKFALYSDAGKSITAFNIDSISSFRNNLAVFYQNGLQGLINRDGKIVHAAEYSLIEISPELRARRQDHWTILTCDNKIEKELEADSVVQLGKYRYKIVRGSISTLVDENFEPVGKESYNFIAPFELDYAKVLKNGSWGIIDIDNTLRLNADFTKVEIDDQFFFGSKINGASFTQEVFNVNGSQISDRHYEAIQSYNGKFFPVKKKGCWGALDKYGAEILPCVYEEILESKFDLVAVKFQGLYGIVNLKEEWIVPPGKNKVKLISPSRYFEQTDDLLYLKSFDNYVYYFTTNPVKLTEAGLIETTSTGAVWTINFDGQIINRQEAYNEPLQEIFPSSEGLRGIRKDGRYGFIDDRARLRIANRYEGIKPFREGLAAMKILGKWGFIDHDEKIVIQPVYNDVTSFDQGYSIAKLKNAYGLLNINGDLILPTRFQNIEVLESGNLLLKIDGKKGLASSNGTILIQCKYDNVQDLGNNFAIVELDDKMGVVDLKGVSTIPTHYDYLCFDPLTKRIIALKRSNWVKLN